MKYIWTVLVAMFTVGCSMDIPAGSQDLDNNVDFLSALGETGFYASWVSNHCVAPYLYMTDTVDFERRAQDAGFHHAISCSGNNDPGLACLAGFTVDGGSPEVPSLIVL